MLVVRTLIFAKAPRAGSVKTRLVPALGAEQAAALAHRMLNHTLDQARQASVGPVELCASPDVSAPAWRGIALPGDISFSAQGEGDLGARLARHAQRAIGHGECVMLIGTDCLQLDATALRQAARALETHDSVMHATEDGGYALLGLRYFDSGLFTGIAWSTASVASTTRSRIEALKWSLHQASILRDIDEPGDLQLLPAEWLTELNRLDTRQEPQAR